MTEALDEQFDRQAFHPQVVAVSRTLFISGHFEQSVSEAFKAVENCVKAKSGRSDLYGKNLMANVFSEDDPILQLNSLKTLSERDEQAGFKFIFMGVSLGIRNPRAHDAIPRGEASTALEYLALASLLLRRVDSSTPTVHAEEIVRTIQQKTFVQKPVYVDAMLDKISPQLHIECARQLVQVCTDKSADARVRDNAVFTFKMLVQRLDASSDDLAATAGMLNASLDDDDNFEIGVHLLTPAHVPLLDSHIREKAFALMVEDLKAGELSRGLPYGSTLWSDLVRLRQAIPDHCRPDICEVLESSMRNGNWYSQGFATRMLHELRAHIPLQQLPTLMAALMKPLLWDTSFSAMEEVSRNITTYDENWITAFAEALLRERGQDSERRKWMIEATSNPNLPEPIQRRLAAAMDSIDRVDYGIPF